MINQQFLNKIPHTFQNPLLLEQALNHPSTIRTSKSTTKGNAFERLEFLGDRVLGLVIAQTVYERFPKETEGDLAKRLAALVCRDACMLVANSLELSDNLKAKLGDLSPNSAILPDAIEALIGAIYLDGGLKPAAEFIDTYWVDLLDKDTTPPKDAKTDLQERAQSKGSGIVPYYEVLQHSGPAHAPIFNVRVSVLNLGTAEGVGNSKRQAEQMAARKLLDCLDCAKRK